MRNFKSNSILLFAFIIGLSVCVNPIFAEDEPFGIYTNNWDASNGGVAFNFYPSGYSDGFWWGRTERHDEDYHEMLSGEWASALAWSQSGSNDAIWLPNTFIFPTFSTGSIFEEYGSPSYFAWNDPYNPINNYDTAYSVIQDSLGQDSIRIRIDYELVDLGVQDANGVGGSPMSFRDANETVKFVYSERWICLQTYSITNISENDINDLEFYQMLCSLYYNDDYSSYTSDNYYDPLSNYTPYNPVHQVGNFRYDITQWGSGDPNTAHVDWISFSSTVEPDAFENGMFYSNWNKPTMGTYTNIENRNLNNTVYSVFNYWGGYDRIAGAMQFNLPDLEPDETTSITFAVMYGCKPIQTTPPIPPIDANLTFTDDTNDNCVYPFISQINYNICYQVGENVNDVNIIATLDQYLNFTSCTGGGIYDSNMHQVLWQLGNLEANDTNCFTLTASVANDAVQGSTVSTTTQLYTGDDLLHSKTKRTDICCIDNVVYVNTSAAGSNNGSNWANAYTDLQTALAAVEAGQHTCANQIWVAAGTYYPTDANDASPETKTFQMLDNIDMYGHFAGWETELCQRNLADANYATILSGDIDQDDTGEVYRVLTCANNIIVDGFTITKSDAAGIYSSDKTNIEIANCTITYNDNYGINLVASNTNPSIFIYNCIINNNDNQGIYCDGTTNFKVYLDVEQCTISSNGSYAGLEGNPYSEINVCNSVFSNNSGRGIDTIGEKLIVENCSFIDNGSGGILTAPNGAYDYPTVVIKNCIISGGGGSGSGIQSRSYAQIVNNIIIDSYNFGINLRSYLNGCNIIGNIIYGGGSFSTTSDAIRLSGSYPITVKNNTIVDNRNGICNDSGLASVVTNNIIWGNSIDDIRGNNVSNTIVNYNCIGDGWAYAGTGNIDSAPCFINTATDDYHLTSVSPCIDTGNPSFTADANETDFDGEARVMLNYVDMGADEFYQSPADLDLDDTVNFYDYAEISDINDLANIAEDWLWLAGWSLSNYQRGIGGEGAYFTTGCGTGLQGYMAMSSGSSEEFLLVSSSVSLKSATTVSAAVPVLDVKEIVNWLEEIWQADKSISQTISEKEWLEFVASVKSLE